MTYLMSSLFHWQSRIQPAIDHKIRPPQEIRAHHHGIGCLSRALLSPQIVLEHLSHNKTQILRSNSSSGLYPFVGFSKLNNNFAFSTTVSSVDIWYKRLGHPSSTSLSHLLYIFLLPCINKCSAPSTYEACQKGKHV
jgi:hypothetical protein